MTPAAHHRRELRRRILETIATMRGHGLVTAADIAERLGQADGLTHRDGRRVAGQLRILAREGLVERADHRVLVERMTPNGYGVDLTTTPIEYAITPEGIDELDRLTRDHPRLTDPQHRAWPRRHRIAARRRPGRS